VANLNPAFSGPMSIIAANSLFDSLRDALVQELPKSLEKRGTRKIRNLLANMQTNALGSRATYRANLRLGQIARDATLAAYTTNVLHAPEYRGQYRHGQDRLSGTLLPTLKSQKNYRANGRTLELFNKKFLYEEAKHYARLNFGAPGSAYRMEKGAKVPVNFAPFKTVGSFRLGVHDAGPTSEVILPAGGFTGKGHFYPASQITGAKLGGGKFGAGISPALIRRRVQAETATRGIRGRHFIEAGVAAAAANVGPVYAGLPREWFLSARSNTK
jgi:hypothetical protein